MFAPVAPLLAVAVLAAPPLPRLPVPALPPDPVEVLAKDLASGLALGDALHGARLHIHVAFDPSDGETRGRGPFVQSLSAALSVGVAPPDGPVLQATRQQASHVLRVAVQERRGGVQAQAVLVDLPTSLWARMLSPEGQVRAQSRASISIGPTIRRLLDPAPRARGRVTWRTRSVEVDATLRGRRVLDMLALDLDGDRHEEILLLGERFVMVARWGGQRLTSGPVATLETVPANGARLRSPLGRLVPVTAADGRVSVLVASSDRAQPLRLHFDPSGWTESTESAGSAWPLYGTGVDTWVGVPWPHERDVLAGPIREVVNGRQGKTRVPSLEAHDARGYGVPSEPGAAWQAVTTLHGTDGRLALWSAGTGARALVLEDVGNVALVVDRSADGRLEVLTTGEAVEGKDHVRLWAAAPSGGRLVERWSRRIAAPVTAAAATRDEAGHAAVLLATWNGSEAAFVRLERPTP